MRLLLILIVFCTFYSCNEFLYLSPETEISEEIFYENTEDFDAAILGCYSGLQSLHNGALLYLTELSTDNATIQWTGPTISQRECDEYSFTFSNDIIEGIWSNCFTSIARSNNVLYRLEESNIDQTNMNQFKGEALFLRAYNYFHLVQLFGDLPIVNEFFKSPDEIFEFNMIRQSEEEVYDFIINDLNQAIDLLNNIDLNEKSRASIQAAQTLLAKVYLTKEDFSNAISLLNQIVESSLFNLQNDYFENFTNGNENLSESIFEIPYLSGNLGEGNSFSTIFTPSIFNMAIFPSNMVGGGSIVPTENVLNYYEEGDVRKMSIQDSVLLTNGNYEKSLYGVKFVDFTSGLIGDGSINFTSLRYADVLLMYAEALVQGNKLEESVQYLNLIRERAGLAPLGDVSQEELLEAIIDERRIEFFCEGHRWFDLNRFNKLAEVMNEYFIENNLNFSVEPHELLLPIPQREININPDLIQNPGY